MNNCNEVLSGGFDDQIETAEDYTENFHHKFTWVL